MICSNIHKNVLFVRIQTIFIRTNVPFVWNYRFFTVFQMKRKSGDPVFLLNWQSIDGFILWQWMKTIRDVDHGLFFRERNLNNCYFQRKASKITTKWQRKVCKMISCDSPTDLRSENPRFEYTPLLFHTNIQKLKHSVHSQKAYYECTNFRTFVPFVLKNLRSYRSYPTQLLRHFEDEVFYGIITWKEKKIRN